MTPDALERAVRVLVAVPDDPAAIAAARRTVRRLLGGRPPDPVATEADAVMATRPKRTRDFLAWVGTVARLEKARAADGPRLLVGGCCKDDDCPTRTVIMQVDDPDNDLVDLVESRGGLYCPTCGKRLRVDWVAPLGEDGP